MLVLGQEICLAPLLNWIRGDCKIAETKGIFRYLCRIE